MAPPSDQVSSHAQDRDTHLFCAITETPHAHSAGSQSNPDHMVHLTERLSCEWRGGRTDSIAVRAMQPTLWWLFQHVSTFAFAP